MSAAASETGEPAGDELIRGLAQLRRVTGTWFFVVAFIARLPVAMNVVGVLTFVSAARGIADAGLVSAALGLAAGVGGPVIGMLADRFGQRPALYVSAVLHTGLLLGLVAVVYADAPLGWLVAFAVGSGATIPPASPLARARWLGLLAEDERRGGRGIPVALGYESSADEISFVGGPILVGALATGFGPAVPVFVAAAVMLVFASAFAAHPTAVVARPAADAAPALVAPRRELLGARVLLPTAGMLAMGAFFGSSLASATTLMEAEGVGEATGLLYGVMGATSAIAAITVDRLPRAWALDVRWVGFAAVMLAVALVMPAVPTVLGVAVCFVVIGFAVGAALVTIFTIGAAAAPAGRLATTMTMLSSSIIIGQGTAMAIASQLAAAEGVLASLMVVIAGTVVGVACALAHLALRRRFSSRAG